MKTKNDQGFSLIEVLVAIVILAAFVVPTCSALVLSARMNAKAQALMQAQLDVSSAVETLMAKGIHTDYKDTALTELTQTDDIVYPEYAELRKTYEGLCYSRDEKQFSMRVLWVVKEEDSCYKVQVISKDGLVVVETTVRAD